MEWNIYIYGLWDIMTSPTKKMMVRGLTFHLLQNKRKLLDRLHGINNRPHCSWLCHGLSGHLVGNTKIQWCL